MLRGNAESPHGRETADPQRVDSSPFSVSLCLCGEVFRLIDIPINREQRVKVPFSRNIFHINKLDLTPQVDYKQGIKAA